MSISPEFYKREMHLIEYRISNEYLSAEQVFTQMKSFIQSIQKENERLASILKEADNYLNTNDLTSIGHGSVMHNKFHGS